MNGAIGAALQPLSSRRIILFGGKGGVGKTTMASLAAMELARRGPTILFTTDPASNLTDIFVENDAVNLRIEELDSAALYQRFLADHLESFLEIADRGTYLDREELRRFFELSLPGVDELMAWMRIGELAEAEPGATLVVDTAPTGHALRMLGAGEHFRQLASALDAMQEKHRSLVEQFTRRSVRDAADEFIDQFDTTARRRRELLTDPGQTAFVAVFLSEPWVVEQTLRLIGEVRAGGIDAPLAILNRAVEEPDCGRCRARQSADHAARGRLAPLPVIDYPRSCVPLWSGGTIPEAGGDLPQSAAVPIPSRARLLFLAGKGGVGKTTCAASIALQLASRNPEARFTIISVDPAHALRDVFSAEPPPANLTVEMVDTRQRWRKFRETLGAEIENAMASLAPKGMSLAYDTEALQKLVEVAPPGADELFAINRLASLLGNETEAQIIVDTAPTGHFLRLVDLPHTAGQWVREFMRILLRYRDLIPPGSLGSELVSASRSLSAVHEALRSERTAVFVVTRPEPIVIAETNRLIEELRSREIRTATVIANHVTPETGCACDATMRHHEIAALRRLKCDPVVVNRRDAPVTGLAELARLFDIASDSSS